MVDGLNWVCHNDKTRFFYFIYFFLNLHVILFCYSIFCLFLI
uniref:Uncharacterized protein n=1 Tax=Anguilla anguilla TaxID=7936 RepID=A0A0E9SJR0_ANGAN